MVGRLAYIASTVDLEQQISSFSLRVIAASSIALILLILISSLFANKKHIHLKKPLFALIVFVITVGTGTLFGSTIYLNVKSDSDGPVHWHADIEFWACGVQLELRNPSGFLSNKIGTSTLHEHNDQRIHLEGVVVDNSVDATVGKFMRVIGGSISSNSMTVPLADSMLEDFVDGDMIDAGGATNIEKYIKNDSLGKKILTVNSGDTCPDNTPGNVQAFVYQFNKKDNTYRQIKLEKPEDYTIRDESIVPPGDCIVVEFGKNRNRTDKLCEQYGVRDSKRCTEFGVSNYNPDLCNIKEVTSSGGNE